MHPYIFALHIIGTLGMLAFGVTSFFAPAVVARAVNFQLIDKRGSAEFRIGLGGFFIGLAVFALLFRQEIVFHALGASWLGGAVSRLLSLLADRPKLDSSYFGLFCLETTMGVFLLI